ncbi:MAG: hypothetical protein A3D10_06570 [Omnitrophica WOR_2 bacterium RIFCSPHIGHO2_02_FULL_48_11]|nr:MAG: hypothetical protein A3D10_06570 [Omnitrophica WOR_2 bacterium RIFCSPHIGHO2_02_FULL_48_11]
MNQKLFLFLLITLLSGCSLYNVESEETTNNLYHPKYAVSDVHYLESVSQPYEIIGYVTVNTERRNTVEQVIDKLKREAALMGGDAITDIQSNASGFWKSLPVQKLLSNAYIRVNFKATVVAFPKSTGNISDSEVAPVVNPEPVPQRTREENFK